MFTTIDKINVHYIKKGKGQPLLFLHGVFLDSSAFKKLTDLLSKKFTVYILDFPMHGKSGDMEKSYSIANYSDLVSKFIKNIKIKDPIIMGYSAGGLIASVYASRKKVKKLILIDPAGIGSKSLLYILFKIIFIMVPLSLFWNPVGFLKILSNGFYNLSKNLFNKKFYESSKEFLKDNIYHLRKIRCPTMIIWANMDEVLPFRNSKIFLKNIKNSKLMKIKGNHAWPVLRPEKINRLINS